MTLNGQSKEQLINNRLLAVFLGSFFIYSCLAARFVWHDGLSTVASDAVNYLLMATYFSPWQSASEAVIHASQYQDFPPLFPLLLSVTGTVHSLPSAHLLTLAFFLASLPVIYLFVLRVLVNPVQSYLLVALFALSPSSWINIMGILSEPLYLFLSMLFLLLLPRLENSSKTTAFCIGLLLAAIILTRSIGMAMFPAYGIFALHHFRKGTTNTINLLIPLIVAGICFFLSSLLETSALPQQYLNQLTQLSLTGQFQNLMGAWLTSWQFYWSDKQLLSVVIVCFVGFFSLVGLLARLLQLKADAIYVLAYLFILLIWPHPGQQVRFLFPILPLLLLYSFVCLRLILEKCRQLPQRKLEMLYVALLLAAVLPAQGFLFFRYKTGTEPGFNHITEYYNLIDLSEANSYASTQIAMFEDLQMISKSTPEDAYILYFDPAFMALLANRKSDPLVDHFVIENNIRTFRNVDADMVYLSRINPRNSSRELNHLELLSEIGDEDDILWMHISPVTNEPVSMLVRISSEQNEVVPL